MILIEEKILTWKKKKIKIKIKTILTEKNLFLLDKMNDSHGRNIILTGQNK